MEDSTFLSQRKYAKNIVKKFGMVIVSHKRTLAPTHLKLSKDEGGISVDQSLYRIMIGSLLYLTANKPYIVFGVGVYARYQAEPKFYQHLQNPIQHSRTKHNDIRHHFIRELIEDKLICLEHVSIEIQLVDIFTKALDATQFENLRSKLGVCIFEEP
ncbi:uncharacterized protein LOC131618754 [Vicia villosa]|uniref:uncharacterized protein LOC131618754 n=1 Tax=Vicia villosa TaxID=3911 RepID=UPI00273CEC15|nr:uncharacterized protein LOC131618754 [Vicia villosa]